MKSCPHCETQIDIRKLRYQGLFKSYRVCPHCKAGFSVDTDTKRRQTICMVVALISLVFTLLLYCESSDWLIPSLLSYAALVGLVYWGNRKLYFVPYERNAK